MKLKNKIKLMTLAMIFMSNYALAEDSDKNSRYFSLPAYNIIADTLMQVTPKVNNVKNSKLMEQVCSIANETISKKQAIDNLRSIIRDTTDLQNAIIFLDYDRTSLTALCVAWTASSLYEVENGSKWLKHKATTNSLPNFFNKLKLWASNDDIYSKGEINEPYFINSSINTLNIALSNTKLYALILSDLLSVKGSLPLIDWKERIIFSLKKHSHAYIKNLRFMESQKITISEFKIDRNGYYLSTSEGLQFYKYDSIPLLKSKGVTWFGEGEIYGEKHFLKVNVN